MDDELTRRQKSVLKQLLRGRTEMEIAQRLRLSAHTVHHHVKAIYRHFRVSRRAELVFRVLGT